MNLLYRSIKALRHSWKRTLLVTGGYSILFSLLLITVLMNISSGTQIEDTQRGIGNAVLVRKVRLNDKIHRPSLSRFREEEVDILTSDDRVESYNIFVMNGANMIDGEPYVADKKQYEDTLSKFPYLKEQMDNARFVGVTDSQRSIFFSGVGFRIVQGRGISQQDAGEKVVLVSETLAKINNWKIGERIKLNLVKNMGKLIGDGFTAKIQGIYECPKDIYTQDTIEYTPDYLPENFLFIPQATVTDMDSLKYSTDMIYVYLKSPDLVKEYIADMEQKLGDVVEDITQTGWQAQFRFNWDEEWNRIVSAPYKEIYNVTQIAMWVILAGTFVVVLLITSGELSEKKREFGIWLACGEKRISIVIQTLFEKLIPMLVAIFLALLLSLAVANPVSNIVVGDSSEQMNRQVQGLRQDVNFWESSYILDIEIQYGNYDYFYINDGVDLYRSRSAIVVSIVGGIVILVIMLTIQIWSIMRKDPRELLDGGEGLWKG